MLLSFPPSLRSGNLGSPNTAFATLKSSAERAACCASRTCLQWKALDQALTANTSHSHAKQRTERYSRSVCTGLRP